MRINLNAVAVVGAVVVALALLGVRTVARRRLPVPFRAMMRMIAAIFLAALVTGTEVAVAQQPAFAPGSGPTVLFDFGHNNMPGTERRASYI